MFEELALRREDIYDKHVSKNRKSLLNRSKSI